MTNEQTNFLDRCESAFLIFVKDNPDYPEDAASASFMANQLKVSGLSPDDPDHLTLAWQKLRPQTAPAVPVEEPTDPVEAEALRMIAAGLSLKTVDAMSARELENNSHSKAFCRALEILKPEPAPLQTRGELVLEQGRREYANKQGIEYVPHDAAALVEKFRRETAEGYATPSVRPAPVPRGASRTVINLNQAVWIPNKRQPTLAEALAQEKKDHAAIEEMRDKSARAIRVKAHRNK